MSSKSQFELTPRLKELRFRIGFGCTLVWLTLRFLFYLLGAPKNIFQEPLHDKIQKKKN